MGTPTCLFLWAAVETGKHINKGGLQTFCMHMYVCFGPTKANAYVQTVHTNAQISTVSMLRASFDQSLGLITLLTMHVALRR